MQARHPLSRRRAAETTRRLLACFPRSSWALSARAHRKGSTSLRRSWLRESGPAASSFTAALCDATFFPLHDRPKPPNATFNVYRAADDNWFLIVLTPDQLAGSGEGNWPRGPADRPAIRGSGEAGSEFGGAHGHSGRSVSLTADVALAGSLQSGPPYIRRRAALRAKSSKIRNSRRTISSSRSRVPEGI